MSEKLCKVKLSATWRMPGGPGYTVGEVVVFPQKVADEIIEAGAGVILECVEPAPKKAPAQPEINKMQEVPAKQKRQVLQ